jgi:hypothetical protein
MAGFAGEAAAGAFTAAGVGALVVLATETGAGGVVTGELGGGEKAAGLGAAVLLAGPVAVGAAVAVVAVGAGEGAVVEVAGGFAGLASRGGGGGVALAAGVEVEADVAAGGLATGNWMDGSADASKSWSFIRVGC